jgi:hypothetical protein
MVGVERIRLAQDIFQWRIVVNSVITCRLCKGRGCLDWLSDYTFQKDASPWSYSTRVWFFVF